MCVRGGRGANKVGPVLVPGAGNTLAGVVAVVGVLQLQPQGLSWT